MNIEKRITNYLSWADNAIWVIVSELSEDEFSKQIGENGRSIKQRYIHLAEDSWEWYHDWIEDNPSDEPNFDEMSREDLFQHIMKYNKLWADLAEKRAVESLEISRKDVSITLSLEEIIFHIANHATYHRGQIVMGLRMLGKEVHMTDYVPFRFFAA